MKYYHIIKGHYLAGQEHCKNSNINHKTTWWEAILMTLEDFLIRNVHYDKHTKSYVVYENVRKRTIGAELRLVTSIYVPPQHRNKGVASALLNHIHKDILITTRGLPQDEVARLYTRRKVL